MDPWGLPTAGPEASPRKYETIRQTLFECLCLAFGEPRRVFTDRVCAEEPVFRTVTAEAKTRRLLADEECKTHDEIRAEFSGRVEKVYPPFGGMSTDARIRLLLADDTPKEIDSIFYRFLIQLFASRERGLASGPAGGRP